jgi:hypothetical protein
MLADEQAGARHLSSNAYVHHYDEGPAEKLDSWFADYLAERQKGGERGAKAWLNKKSKKKNSKLGQIFNHKETAEYLLALREFRPHFNEDTFFSMNFCTGKLHKTNGGVSI